MHGSIRDGLEGLLAGKQTGLAEQELRQHLSSCEGCEQQLAAMQAQSEMLQLLRYPEELDPAPGFYARVLQRIEERARVSIWAAFIQSAFGRRLMYASVSVTLILGTYVVAEEALDGHLRNTMVSTQDTHRDIPVVGTEAQQRDAVLANFESHPVPGLHAQPISYEGTVQ
ncbi:MAG: hypothetical protein JO108_06075 [Acidobacteriaceae bacterium]|nr:hypothetical protein [Acidobacteriaceae bacterium]